MANRRADDFFPCPHCGADVMASARFCRECGADERSGWSDQVDDDYADDDYDDDFDYDEFVRREFPDQAEAAPRNIGVIVVVILLCLGMLGFLFDGKKMSGSVQEVSHPLIQTHLTRLHNESTSPELFRQLVGRLAVLLAYEATKDLELETGTVTTPLTETTGYSLRDRVALVPILRAGLGMVDPILNLIPSAEVWHLGLYRDEETARPVRYYDKLPKSKPVDVALVVDPMLATGGSAIAALETLQDWGVPRLKLLSIIAAPEGTQEVSAKIPDVDVYVCAIDKKLNDSKFIVPGLGDAGDRTFNTLI